MLKRKVNVFFTTFVIILLFFTIFKYSFGKKIEKDNNWKVVILSDTKEINDTHMIKFEVNKSQDVIQGKIAPGMTAIASIDIDLTKIEEFVDIEIEIDDSEISKSFKLNTRIDGEILDSNVIKKVESGNIKNVLLEIIWNEDNLEDTKIGINTESIVIPIKIRVLQHI